jgi:DGQHR domain-containing protein
MRGQSRTTTYYQVELDYGEIEQLVRLPQDSRNNPILDPRLEMQRKLAWKRIEEGLVPYLEHDDAFFNSLVLIIVPRTYEPLEEGDGYVFEPFQTPDGTDVPFGTLELQSSCFLFPADGQHRSAAIMEFLKRNPKMAGIRTPAILLPYQGREKVRQLFSDLNLNAKAVSKTIGLDFEGRDPLALLTKAVADRVELFKARVNRRTNSLPKSSADVIALNTLFTGTTELAKALGFDFAEDSEDLLEDATEAVARVWEVILEALTPWQEVLAGERKPGELREEFVFAHGLGWQAIALVAAGMIREDADSWEERLTNALSAMDWRRTAPHWENVACIFTRDPITHEVTSTRVNNTGPAVKTTAALIKSYVDGQPSAAALARVNGQDA